jgi:hypothetical protein
MDRLINTQNKRFMVGTTLYVLLMLQFYIGLFKVSSLFVSFTSSNDLLLLTSPQTRAWYWPIELVANLMDQRFSVFNTLVITFKTLPSGFWIVMILALYLVGFKINRNHFLYHHQLRFIILILISWISVFIHMLLFIYGFFGGSVATAIARVNLSGYVGIFLGVGFSVLSIILLSLLWVEIYQNLEH